MKVARPALRWHGGKWRIAPKIIERFPEHGIYTEAFGGAGSILLRKPMANTEVYNDMDGEVVNLFRVLQRPAAGRELQRRLELTPFARAEFIKAKEKAAEPVERARRLLIRSFMGVGSDSASRPGSTGFRRAIYSKWRSGNPARSWDAMPEIMAQVLQRFRGVIIENRPAVEVVQFFDGKNTLHYVDPPYIHSLRTDEHHDNYRHEMTDQQHRDLARVLHDVKGMVVFSGYASALYDQELYPEWERTEISALADGAKKRTEVLWLNQAAARRRHG